MGEAWGRPRACAPHGHCRLAALSGPPRRPQHAWEQGGDGDHDEEADEEADEEGKEEEGEEGGEAAVGGRLV